MVYISDKKRVICPFCGSFYREKSVDEFLRKQERINDSKKVMIINFRKWKFNLLNISNKNRNLNIKLDRILQTN